MVNDISLPESELVSLALTTFLNGTSWTLNNLVAVCVPPELTTTVIPRNRCILYPIFHNSYNDILCERIIASSPHKDAPGVVLDACGVHYGASVLTKPAHSVKH